MYRKNSIGSNGHHFNLSKKIKYDLCARNPHWAGMNPFRAKEAYSLNLFLSCQFKFLFMIAVKDVLYYYPGEKIPALKNISFELSITCRVQWLSLNSTSVQFNHFSDLYQASSNIQNALNDYFLRK